MKAECLAARMKQWYTDKPNEPKAKKYQVFRSQMDKFTSGLCSEYAKVDQRKQTGAEIYLASSEAVAFPESEEETDSVEESILDNDSTNASDKEVETYHCYTSCLNYSRFNPCSKPDLCRQLQKEKKTGRHCPIKKMLGEHKCGDQGKMA